MSGDVREILEIQSQQSSEVMSLLSDKAPKQPKPIAKPKKPEGMSMEVYRLYLARSAVIPTDAPGEGYVQHKVKIGNRRAVEWKSAPFTNPARNDALTLTHWIKKVDMSKEYKFARWNKTLQLPAYSDEEYASVVETTPPGILAALQAVDALPAKAAVAWSKPDTDHLFELCRTYDLRFPVIQDRFRGSAPRTMEELKDRFYSVCNMLAVHRAQTHQGIQQVSLLPPSLAGRGADADADALPDAPLLDVSSAGDELGGGGGDDGASAVAAAPSSAAAKTPKSAAKGKRSTPQTPTQEPAAQPGLGHTPTIAGAHIIHYDAEHEAERKKQLEVMFHRTIEQIREEEFLVSELKKIEAKRKEREKEREHATRLLEGDFRHLNHHSSKAMGVAATVAAAGGTSGAGAGAAGDAGGDGTPARRKKKRGGPYHHHRHAASASSGASSGAAPGTDSAAQSESVTGPYNAASSSAQAVAAVRKDRTIGAHLRSSRFAPLTVGVKTAKKVDMLLEDLGVNVRFIPSQAVCDSFDELRAAILSLLDLKKHMDAREYDITLLKHRRRALLQQLHPNEDFPEEESGAATSVSADADPDTYAAASVSLAAANGLSAAPMATGSSDEANPGGGSGSGSGRESAVPMDVDESAGSGASRPSTQSHRHTESESEESDSDDGNEDEGEGEGEGEGENEDEAESAGTTKEKQDGPILRRKRKLSVDESDDNSSDFET